MNRLFFGFAIGEIQIPDTYHGAYLIVKLHSYSKPGKFPGSMTVEAVRLEIFFQEAFALFNQLPEVIFLFFA
ncbi:MAG: hypothetical protein K9J30_10090 [Bacteroidales bacterium]|nr:hypothetical protein [Bacteroidales bacterium]